MERTRLDMRNLTRGVKPKDIDLGDLLYVPHIGQCIAAKWFATASLGVIIVDPESKGTGEWRYLRSSEFKESWIIAKGEKHENDRF